MLAAAVGTGGMAGMSSALAADPGMVGISGTLVDGDGAALAGVHLVITEELAPDGGAAAFQTTTGADGAFVFDVYGWGTADAPATVTIETPADEELEVIGETCSQTWSVTLHDVRSLALADAAPEPLALTATTALLGEVCGTTGTPGGNSGGSAGGGGGAQITPPPTDLGPALGSSAPDRLGPALVAGFAIGLVVAMALLPRPGARRRG